MRKMWFILLVALQAACSGTPKYYGDKVGDEFTQYRGRPDSTAEHFYGSAIGCKMRFERDRDGITSAKVRACLEKAGYVVEK